MPSASLTPQVLSLAKLISLAFQPLKREVMKWKGQFSELSKRQNMKC